MDLIDLHTSFQAEYFILLEDWEVYRGLFMGADEVRTLLEESGANFFHDLERVYLESILLRLCRLTDRPNTGCQQNAVLERLLEHFDESDTRTNLDGSLRRVKESCEFARTHRDKVIAHRDLSVSRPGGRSELPELTAERIERALAAIDEYLRDVQAAFSGLRPIWRGSIPIAGFPTLVRRLWEAKQWREEHGETGVVEST